MIITAYGIIIFQLLERIAATKIIGNANASSDVFGFSYPALPSRHEVPRVPYLQEEICIIHHKPTKLSSIAGMA